MARHRAQRPVRVLEPAEAWRVERLIETLYAGAWADAPPDRPLGAMALVGDVDEAAALLAEPDVFVKDYDLLTVLGHSRFDARGEEWAARRDLTQPVLRAAAVTDRHPAIAKAYADRFAAVDQAEGLDRAILAAASDVLLSAFGATVPGEEVADWLLSFRPLARRVQIAGMFGGHQAGLAALRADIAAARDVIDGVLTADPALMAWCAWADARMAARPAAVGRPGFDAATELVLALLAGTETTAASLAWAVRMLAADPVLQARLVEAAARDGGRAPEIAVFTQEVMRYFPPVPVLTRRVIGGDRVLAGRPVREGTLLALDVIRLHHDRRWWDRPRQFRADRAEFAERTYHRRAFLPFSAGARVCGGTGLARAEVHWALAALLQRFRIQTGAGAPGVMQFEYALTMRPQGLSDLALEPRHG